VLTLHVMLELFGAKFNVCLCHDEIETGCVFWLPAMNHGTLAIIQSPRNEVSDLILADLLIVSAKCQTFLSFEDEDLVFLGDLFGVTFGPFSPSRYLLLTLRLRLL
jgi:hypothetical protein